MGHFYFSVQSGDVFSGFRRYANQKVECWIRFFGIVHSIVFSYRHTACSGVPLTRSPVSPSQEGCPSICPCEPGYKRRGSIGCSSPPEPLPVSESVAGLRSPWPSQKPPRSACASVDWSDSPSFGSYGRPTPIPSVL